MKKLTHLLSFTMMCFGLMACSSDEPAPGKSANAASYVKADLNKHLPASNNEWTKGDNWPAETDGGRDLVIEIKSSDREIADFLISSFYTFAEIPTEGGDFSFVFSNDYISTPPSIKGVEIITSTDGLDFSDKSYGNALSIISKTHADNAAGALKHIFTAAAESDNETFGYVSPSSSSESNTLQTYHFPVNKSGKPRVIVVSVNHEDTALLQGDKEMCVYKFTFVQY